MWGNINCRRIGTTYGYLVLLPGSDSYMGSSFIGFGLYISAIAAIGILIAAYMFRSPADNIKDSFNTLKKDIESKINNSGNTPTHQNRLLRAIHQ